MIETITKIPKGGLIPGREYIIDPRLLSYHPLNQDLYAGGWDVEDEAMIILRDLLTAQLNNDVGYVNTILPVRVDRNGIVYSGNRRKKVSTEIDGLVKIQVKHHIYSPDNDEFDEMQLLSDENRLDKSGGRNEARLANLAPKIQSMLVKLENKLAKEKKGLTPKMRSDFISKESMPWLVDPKNVKTALKILDTGNGEDLLKEVDSGQLKLGTALNIAEGVKSSKNPTVENRFNLVDFFRNDERAEEVKDRALKYMFAGINSMLSSSVKTKSGVKSLCLNEDFPIGAQFNSGNSSNAMQSAFAWAFDELGIKTTTELNNDDIVFVDFCQPGFEQEALENKFTTYKDTASKIMIYAGLSAKSKNFNDKYFLIAIATPNENGHVNLDSRYCIFITKLTPLHFKKTPSKAKNAIMNMKYWYETTFNTDDWICLHGNIYDGAGNPDIVCLPQLDYSEYVA